MSEHEEFAKLIKMKKTEARTLAAQF